MSYPGGKEGEGVLQRLLNAMPRHRVYVELFAGGGAVLRHKEPAEVDIAVEYDEPTLAALRARLEPERRAQIVWIRADALKWLRKPWTYRIRSEGDRTLYDGRDFQPIDLGPDVLLYADPPYPLGTRRTDRVRYPRELTDDEHVELLELLTQVKANVMLSGYRCPLYDAWLAEWRRIDYQAMTRGGTLADESLWLNFSPPAELHGYARVGDDYRDRERIKRKRRRWLSNFAALPDHEREAIWSDLSTFQQRRKLQ